MRSFREIAKMMDSVETPESLRTLIDMHRWAPSEIKSFRGVVERHSSNKRKLRRFLCMNTYLMDTFAVAEKPAVEFRAPEFGAIIRKNHDIALLQEIFEDNVKDKILSRWPHTQQPSVAEDARTNSKDSSGLVIISQKDKVSRPILHEFDNREGMDVWADKGVIRTTIDLGFGASKLELYNTHLNFEGHSARRMQLLELMSFIKRQRNKNNFSIVAGDFNLSDKDKAIAYRKGRVVKKENNDLITLTELDDFDNINNIFQKFIDRKITHGNYTNGMTEHQALVELMGFLGFKDMWTERNGTTGLTENVHKKSIRDQICKPDKDNSELCDDSGDTDHSKSKRLDYMFISEPEDSHSFSVDFTRPRRVRYERARNAPDRDKIDMLSDHLGLSTTLLFSPVN